MSEGGLLEKAAEQNPSPTVISAEHNTPKAGNVGVGEALKTVALFGIFPVLITRILLVYLPGDELTIPVIGTSLVMFVVFLSSLVVVLWRLGVFSISSSGFALSGTSAIASLVVAISYICLLYTSPSPRDRG